MKIEIRKRARATALAALALALLACAPATASAAAPPPLPAPSEFVARVDNPWFPLRPGTSDVYRGRKGGRTTREVVAVYTEKKRIEGVECTVVNDKVWVRGGRRWRVVERTWDWYAQDRAGNVWYLGEETTEIGPEGGVVSREGSWRAGVDGARAGIFMPAHPRRGQTGVQESYPGHAEDRFRVLSLSASVRTPAASSRRALLTREWSPLEPGTVERKYYVKGIGPVLEETVKGGDERSELVAVRR